jgi:hypothetical protein
MQLMNWLTIATLRYMAFGMFPRHPVKELVMVDVPQRFLAAPRRPCIWLRAISSGNCTHFEVVSAATLKASRRG